MRGPQTIDASTLSKDVGNSSAQMRFSIRNTNRNEDKNIAYKINIMRAKEKASHPPHTKYTKTGAVSKSKNKVQAVM